MADGQSPVPSSTTMLQGNAEVRHRIPGNGPQCQPAPNWPLKAMKATLDTSGDLIKKASARKRGRLKGGATKRGTPQTPTRPLTGGTGTNVPGPLLPRTPSLANNPPLKAKTNKDYSPPPAPPFNPLHPQMGQQVPPGVTKVPPGWIVVHDPNNPKGPGILLPDENAKEDFWDPFFILFTIVTFGAPAAVAPVTVPIEEGGEWVWVYTRANGEKIIWREGTTWYKKTVTSGELVRLEKALEQGARFPKALYDVLTRGGGF